MTNAQRIETLERRIVNLERAMLQLLQERQVGLPWSIRDAPADVRGEYRDFIDWFMDQR